MNQNKLKRQLQDATKEKEIKGIDFTQSTKVLSISFGPATKPSPIPSKKIASFSVCLFLKNSILLISFRL